MLQEEKLQAKESFPATVFDKKADNYLEDEPQLDPYSRI
jgi:hypothetical protein